MGCDVPWPTRPITKLTLNIEEPILPSTIIRLQTCDEWHSVLADYELISTLVSVMPLQVIIIENFSNIAFDTMSHVEAFKS